MWRELEAFDTPQSVSDEKILLAPLFCKRVKLPGMHGRTGMNKQNFASQGGQPQIHRHNNREAITGWPYIEDCVF